MKTHRVPANSVPVRREQDRLLFDASPINLDGFVLKAHEAIVVGKPTLRQWRTAFAFAVAAEEASPYWVGDLWIAAEARPDWRERLQQALADVGRPLSFKRLQNLGAISKAVRGKARAISPSIGHSEVVVTLDPAEQAGWLERAADEEWTTRELRQAIDKTHRPRVIDGRADTMYTVEVTVQVEVEAASPYFAKDAAWKLVKDGLGSVPHAKVILAHIRPGRESMASQKTVASA